MNKEGENITFIKEKVAVAIKISIRKIERINKKPKSYGRKMVQNRSTDYEIDVMCC